MSILWNPGLTSFGYTLYNSLSKCLATAVSSQVLGFIYLKNDYKLTNIFYLIYFKIKFVYQLILLCLFTSVPLRTFVVFDIELFCTPEYYSEKTCNKRYFNLLSDSHIKHHKLDPSPRTADSSPPEQLALCLAGFGCKTHQGQLFFMVISKLYLGKRAN